MRTVTLALATVAVFALTGCNEEAAQKLANPVTKEVSDVDGCVVKYVDRGYVSNSFYIARCPGLGETVTTSQTGGKHNSLMTAVTRTETAAERVAREQVAQLAAQKKSALSKLTAEERQALGL